MIFSIVWNMLVPIIIVILFFLLILKLINKFIFKNKVKINLKEILIAWIVIFCFNLVCVTFDFPYPIGVPYSIFADGGKTKFYASLGYIIKVEKSSIFIEDNITTTVTFEGFYSKEDKEIMEEKIQKGNSTWGYDVCKEKMHKSIVSRPQDNNSCLICGKDYVFGVLCWDCAGITNRCVSCGKLENEN